MSLFKITLDLEGLWTHLILWTHPLSISIIRTPESGDGVSHWCFRCHFVLQLPNPVTTNTCGFKPVQEKLAFNIGQWSNIVFNILQKSDVDGDCQLEEIDKLTNNQSFCFIIILFNPTTF